MLDEILLPSFEVEFIVENRPLARRLHDAGRQRHRRRPAPHRHLSQGRPQPQHLRHHRRQRPAQPDARFSKPCATRAARSIYVLGVGAAATAQARRGNSRRVSRRRLPGDVGAVRRPLLTEFSRSLTRARVQQYQRYFSDADRVLILLHNDPDPDAMASGLALRNVLRRTKTTAIIGAHPGRHPPGKPADDEPARHPRRDAHAGAAARNSTASRWWTCSRTISAGHRPRGPGDRSSSRAGGLHARSSRTSAPDYGSTCTILTEHLRAVDANISERTATAMLYAIKSDTLFFNRQTNRVDIEAFSYLYPLADAALIRKMEGAEITAERLDYVMKAHAGGKLVDQVFCSFSRDAAARRLRPYVADFFLQLEHVKWTVIAGVVHDSLIISVRNLGYTQKRRRIRAAILRRHRQRRRPPGDGQGGGPDARLPREICASPMRSRLPRGSRKSWRCSCTKPPKDVKTSEPRHRPTEV